MSTDYPFTGDVPKMDWVLYLRCFYESHRKSKRLKNKKTLEMSVVNQRSELGNESVPLVFVTHNDMPILEEFLNYYRSLGVTHFIGVDDQSSDGSSQFLAEQPDVDLWTSPVRYKDAERGRRWREQMFSIYGENRWYVNVDSDEFLTYDGCQKHPLPHLFRELERVGDKRLAAPMLDMYGRDYGNDTPSSKSLFQQAPFFDRSGYVLRNGKRGARLYGGPRRRKFGENNELMKYPVIFWDKNCSFDQSPHSPLPYYRNLPKTWGALLHFKFPSNYREKIAYAVKEGQHYNGASHYKTMQAKIQSDGQLTLYDDEVSLQFEGPEQLLKLGFMTAISYR